MTNLLLKNPDYHKVAVLWKFIDSYTKLGISFDIEETKGVFNEDYFNEIYGLTAASLATLQTKLDDDRHIELLDGEGNVTEKKPDLSRKYEPKVMINLEDEVFLTHKFRYDQFPEHDGLREEPEREDEEMQDFAWTPEETKRFKETDKEYLSAQLVTAKEKREEAERDRSIMDRDALLAEMERRKKEEARLEREKALEEERLREEERRRLEELDEIARKEAEERLARENALLEEARAKIMAMATEDELIEDSIYESMNKHVEPHATEVEDENVLRSKEEPKEASAPSGLEDAFGALSFTAGRLQDELEKAKAELEEKNRRIAELEAKLSGVPAAPVMEETKAPEAKEEAPVVHFAPKKPKAKTLNIRKSNEPKQAIKQTPVIIIAGSSKKKNKKGAFFKIKK